MPASVRGIAAAVALFAAGTAFGVLLMRHGAVPAAAARPAASAATAPASDEVAKLEAENDALRARLRLALTTVEKAAAQAAASQREQASEDPAAPPPTPEQEAAWLEARARFYDAELARQPRNEAWAAPLEARAQEFANKHQALGVKFVDARCYASACRFEYAYPNGDARLAHLQALPRDFRELPRASYSYPGAPADDRRVVLHLTTKTDPLPPYEYPGAQ
jgi:hypothetical protein